MNSYKYFSFTKLSHFFGKYKDLTNKEFKLFCRNRSFDEVIQCFVALCSEYSILKKDSEEQLKRKEEEIECLRKEIELCHFTINSKNQMIEIWKDMYHDAKKFNDYVQFNSIVEDQKQCEGIRPQTTAKVLSIFSK